MSRPRTGFIFTDEKGKLFVRIDFTDSKGNQRKLKRLVASGKRSDARAMLKNLLSELEEKGEAIYQAHRMTFTELACWYREQYLHPPQYRDGRKVSGLRSYKDNDRRLRILEAHFGETRIRSITYAVIEAFRNERLMMPTSREISRAERLKIAPVNDRSIADVNRALAVLKHVLTLAVREGWLSENPFSRGTVLIDTASERQRTRILSTEEEDQLLAACVGPRAHLRPIIIAALDTGMRRGELFKMCWRDVNLAARRIFIPSLNTKTLRERAVPITDRLAQELEALQSKAPSNPETLVFGILNNIAKAWGTVRRETGLLDVRLHDLRHTSATRLVQRGMPLVEVGRILGHSTVQMSFRYSNATDSTIDRAAQLLNQFNDRQASASSLVN